MVDKIKSNQNVNPASHIPPMPRDRSTMSISPPPVPQRGGCGPDKPCIGKACEKWTWIDEASQTGGCGIRVGAAAQLAILKELQK